MANELRRLDEALPLRERLRPLQNGILARPATGLEADKAFYEALSAAVTVIPGVVFSGGVSSILRA